MKIKRRRHLAVLLALALALSPVPSAADDYGPSGMTRNGENAAAAALQALIDSASGQATFTKPGAPASIVITPAPLASALGALTETTTIDNFSGRSASARWNYFGATLTSSSPSNNTWENLFSTVETSSGTFNAEINLAHTFFQNDLGATVAQVENEEISAWNFGHITAWNGLLAFMQNKSTGTAASLLTTKFQLENDNTAAGSIVTYAAIDNEAMSGAGTHPTSEYFIRNANPQGAISTLGYVNIGALGISGTPLSISGPDTSGSTKVVSINSSGGELLNIVDSGQLTLDSGSSLNVAAGFIAVHAASHNGSSFPLRVQNDQSTDLFAVKDEGHVFAPISFTVGTLSAFTLTTGEMGFAKITPSGSAPGAGGGKIAMVCGTAAGSLKIIAYGGTSLTPVTVVDNIGSGATGC